MSNEEQRAAERALEHADTPSRSFVDALGRVFLSEAKLTTTAVVRTKTELDIEGQALSVTDSLSLEDTVGRVCAEAAHSMGGQGIWSSHIDSGKGRWARAPSCCAKPRPAR